MLVQGTGIRGCFATTSLNQKLTADDALSREYSNIPQCKDNAKSILRNDTKDMTIPIASSIFGAHELDTKSPKRSLML